MVSLEDWQTVAAVSTAVGTAVALVGVLVTLIMTLRSEKLTRAGQALEREQAEATAARTEAAAALTEEYTRRVVDALETMASRPKAASAPPGPATVSWSLTHHAGDTNQLQNVGGLRADDVTISTDPTLHLVQAPDVPTQLQPGEAVTFMAAASLGTRDRTITVSWADAGESDRRSWRYPLPPRPPRVKTR